MKKILIFNSLIFLLSSCNNLNRDNSLETEFNSNDTVVLSNTQITNAEIKTGKMSKQIITELLMVNGRIEAPPQNMVSVCAPLGGYLKSTILLPGTKIKRGEVIAVMEDAQYIVLQQDYLNNLLKLNYLNAEFTRQKELNESKAGSDKILQQAEMDYKAQKIQNIAMREKLKLISIDPDNLSEQNLSRDVNMYSPIDGYVSKVNVNIGKYVNPSDVLFELINPEDIHLALTVFEKDIAKLKVGQKLQAFSNYSKKMYPCEIILVGKNVSAERSLEVHCHFEDYDHSLLPGMYMNANINLLNDSVYVVEEAAVVSFEGSQFIFIELEKGKYLAEKALLGNHNNGMVEIINSQMFQNRKLVISGAYSLLMSMKNKSE